MGKAKRIKLTRGKSVVVDADDAARLGKHKWYAGNTGAKTDYAMRKEPDGEGGQKTVYLHREVEPDDKDRLVDHKNRKGLDDRKQNLRPASQSQNQKGVKHARRRKK